MFTWLIMPAFTEEVPISIDRINIRTPLSVEKPLNNVTVIQ